MKHTRKKSNETKRHVLLLPVFLVAVVALILVATAPVSWAFGGHGHGEVELDEAEVFIEYNSTDGDFGIHFFWDGEPWKWMMVKNERRRPVLSVWANKNVKAQGLTEAFFESAEPTLDELPFQEFLDRFSEGDYTFRGRTLDRKWLVGEAELTHNIPCPPFAGSTGEPGTLQVGWRAVRTVVDREWDSEEEEEDPVCTRAPDDFEIVAYEVVFEMEALVGAGDDEEERVFVDTATLPAPPDVRTFYFTASPEFVSAAANFRAAGKLLVLKFEVIAIEASGNRTITEETLWEAEEDE
jgi:hypothetical protein